MNIQQGIQAIVEGKSLDLDGAASVMSQIMDGQATPAQTAAFITALRMKGETPEEIAGMARAMREKSLHVEVNVPVVDTCGTGGDGKKWFNISTCAAFVVAGAGVAVAKHGNRAMSGSSGSADALEKLGVKITLSPEGVKRCIEEAGVGFMFAQAFHPAMKHAGPVRREIGIRTVFNVLGPLTNPAGAKRQIIGIADEAMAEKVAKALALLGTDYAMIVHAMSGADEIDVEGETLIYQVTPDALKRRRTRPADFGLPEGSRDHLVVPSVDQSVTVIRGVLAGKGGQHNMPPSVERSARNVVVMNAAAALVAAGRANSFNDGAEMAQESIDSGKARQKLEQLTALSQSQT
ncbi:MAG: anthranilate phosphoribosyltransferase [Dehalococcoidia bacterium]|nr:anthranilate phosphoribosyltransferase [Dehalococcoidia bacterium]MSQ34302.1 anthranilate phosphoribosyltransferase [Dehalococcoidia bacterium]